MTTKHTPGPWESMKGVVMTNEASHEYSELARRLRRALRMGELTPEQAQAAYDAAEPVELSDATVDALVGNAFEPETRAEEPADHDYITDANGLGVAELHDRDHDGERHANARLIAAAPDLLAACEALVGKLRSDETWGDHIKAGRLTMDIDEEAIDAALAAIAIVKGG